MSEWVSGLDTPQTVMTTRAPAVLKMAHIVSDSALSFQTSNSKVINSTLYTAFLSVPQQISLLCSFSFVMEYETWNMEHGTNENPSIDRLNRASLGLSQPTVQRQTGRRRDLRSRFNSSFLHQRLSWLVLFLTVEVNYNIHYIILYTSYFLSKSCLNHCALYGDSKQL